MYTRAQRFWVLRSLGLSLSLPTGASRIAVAIWPHYSRNGLAMGLGSVAHQRLRVLKG